MKSPDSDLISMPFSVDIHDPRSGEEKQMEKKMSDSKKVCSLSSRRITHELTVGRSFEVIESSLLFDAGIRLVVSAWGWFTFCLAGPGVRESTPTVRR